MHEAAQFLAFLAAAYGLSLATWPVLGLRRFGVWFTLCMSCTIMFTPLLIGRQHVTNRALACVLAIELFFKLTDIAVQRRIFSSEDHSFRSFARFLVPFPMMLVRFGEQYRRSQFNFSRWYVTVFGLLVFGLCALFVEWLSDIAMVQSSFLFDHTVKFVIFLIAIESLARFVYGLEHHVGYDTKPLINHAFLSLTVGEFWHRYNTRVYSWFDHNVFRPSGGRRAPVRGVLLTFFVSAVLHEVGFAVATSRIDGYQFAFFMSQAPAVILWRYLQRVPLRCGWRQFTLRSSTILWFWATSMLFFHGMNRVFPFFYASTPWLP